MLTVVCCEELFILPVSYSNPEPPRRERLRIAAGPRQLLVMLFVLPVCISKVLAGVYFSSAAECRLGGGDLDLDLDPDGMQQDQMDAEPVSMSPLT